jgi:hypothetical protein
MPPNNPVLASAPQHYLNFLLLPQGRDHCGRSSGYELIGFWSIPHRSSGNARNASMSTPDKARFAPGCRQCNRFYYLAAAEFVGLAVQDERFDEFKVAIESRCKKSGATLRHFAPAIDTQTSSL